MTAVKLFKPSKPWSVLFMRYLRSKHRRKYISPDLLKKYVSKFCMLYSLPDRTVSSRLLMQSLTEKKFVIPHASNTLELVYEDEHQGHWLQDLKRGR